MKIALSLFYDRISPRFDVAPKLRLYDIEEGRIINEIEISCEGWNDMERALKLKEFGVDILICGGIPNYLYNTLSNNGIKVYHRVTGKVQDTLEMFLKSQLNIERRHNLGRRRNRKQIKKSK